MEKKKKTCFNSHTFSCIRKKKKAEALKKVAFKNSRSDSQKHVGKLPLWLTCGARSTGESWEPWDAGRCPGRKNRRVSDKSVLVLHPYLNSISYYDILFILGESLQVVTQTSHA